jgi:hypothetical protein
MNALTRLTLPAAAACAVAACSLNAQQIPAQEPGPRLVNTRLINGEIQMRDAANNRILIDNRGVKLFDPNAPDAVVPEITLNEQPAGFDLVFFYHNAADRRRPLGDIHLGILPLGRRIIAKDFRNTSKDLPLDFDTSSAQGWLYPGDLYSPVAVLRNDDYAVGVSLQYPVLAYEHDVCVSILMGRGALAAGEGGPGWTVHFALAGSPHGRPMQYPAMIEPGEKRRYVVSLRITKNPNEWIRTLTPYRDYFSWGYGGVRYQRDPEPVVGLNPAEASYISPSNPSGWGTARRPDLNGWGPWTRYMHQDLGAWRSFMVWAPSGLYNQNISLNYPFQFTTHWMADPKTATAIDPVNGFPSVRSHGHNLGLWWGRSLQVATTWNPQQMTPLDPRNTTHVHAAMAELDLAVQAGANIIGLDTFTHDYMPIWQQVLWLGAMQERAPGVKFVIEPSACDIMHRLAASYVHGPTTDPNPATIEDLWEVKNPDALADFLLPGHETWIGLGWDGYRRRFGQNPPEQRIRDDIKRFARMGYVPALFAKTTPSPDFRAAESWNDTIPQEIRLQPGAPAGILAQPGNTGEPPQGSLAPGSSGSGVAASGAPINPFMAARIFSREQLRAAIRAAMGLP